MRCIENIPSAELGKFIKAFKYLTQESLVLDILESHGVLNMLIDLLSKDLDYEIHNPAIKALTNIIKGNPNR